MNWYQLPFPQVLSDLATSETGLTHVEAKERLARIGPNKLAEEGKINKLKLLLHQFQSPLIYILLIAAGVTTFLQEYKDAAVIGVILFINAMVGFFQEFKAEKNVRALKQMVVTKARVLRDGRELELNSEELVPGDIVLLASGARVPADLRLIRTIELKIDESMLTGESVPVEKHADVIAEDNLTPGDQRNMAFMGAAVVNGRAQGVVVATGPRSILGRIARDVQELGVTKSPLQEKFERFANIIGVIVLVAAALLFLIGILVGEKPADMFMTVVAAAVATIPEGLPIVVTITLAVGVARMAQRNAIIRHLPEIGRAHV